MSETEILKLVSLSGLVLFAVTGLFIAGGLLTVIVCATLADAVLRQIEARRAMAETRNGCKKL